MTQNRRKSNQNKSRNLTWQLPQASCCAFESKTLLKAWHKNTELNFIHGNEHRVLSFCPKWFLMECCERHNAGKEKKGGGRWKLLSADKWHRRREGQMLPRVGSAKQKPKEEQSHSAMQATCRQRREGGSELATAHCRNLRLKRSKRSRIKGLVCVCRHPCLMVQPGFQLISTLKAKVYFTCSARLERLKAPIKGPACKIEQHLKVRKCNCKQRER